MYLIENALEQHRNGQLAEAEKIYCALLKLDPADINANFLLGTLLYQQSNFAKAKGYLSSANKLKKNDLQILLALVNCYIALEELDSALDLLKTTKLKHYQLAVKHLDVLDRLGRGNLLATIKLYSRFKTQWPESIPLKQKWADIAKNNNNLRLAQKLYQEILQREPNKISTLHNMAVVERILGNPDVALKLLTKVLSLNHDSFQLYHNLGNTYTDLGQIESAVNCYNKAIAKNPTFAESYSNLTQLLAEQGDFEQVIRLYDKAISLSRYNTEILFGYADVLLRLQQYSKVLHLLSQFEVYLRDEEKYQIKKAKAYEGIGEFFQAEELLGSNNSPAILQELCRLKLIMNKPKEVIPIASQLTQEQHYDIMAKANLFVAQRLLGNSEYRDSYYCYERFVKTYDIEHFLPNCGVDKFCEKLNQKLTSMHTTNHSPLFQTINGGTQTKGELFSSNDEHIVSIVEFAKQCIIDYTSALAESGTNHKLSPQPFNTFKFNGSWSVVLKSDGYHNHHVHPEGKLSAVFYVCLPEEINSSNRQGYLVFGKPNYKLRQSLEYEFTITPKVGRLVIFPSYFWHGTLPFESSQDRVTIAFDVAPD